MTVSVTTKDGRKVAKMELPSGFSDEDVAEEVRSTFGRGYEFVIIMRT